VVGGKADLDVMMTSATFLGGAAVALHCTLSGPVTEVGILR
jgi:hypothetical protein